MYQPERDKIGFRADNDDDVHYLVLADRRVKVCELADAAGISSNWLLLHYELHMKNFCAIYIYNMDTLLYPRNERLVPTMDFTWGTSTQKSKMICVLWRQFLRSKGNCHYSLFKKGKPLLENACLLGKKCHKVLFHHDNALDSIHAMSSSKNWPSILPVRET